MVALVAAASVAVPSVRELILRAAGWALVVHEPVAPAHIAVSKEHLRPRSNATSLNCYRGHHVDIVNVSCPTEAVKWLPARTRSTTLQSATLQSATG